MWRALQLAAAWAPRASDTVLVSRISRQLTAADSLAASQSFSAAGFVPASADVLISSEQAVASSALWHGKHLQHCALSQGRSVPVRHFCSDKQHRNAPEPAGDISAQLAQIRPLLQPQATDDEHPLEEGHAAWPFNARAYYVGRELRPMLARMRKSSRRLGFKEAWTKDSPLFCLNAGAQLSDTAAETGLPCETYVAVFDRMASVVFVNAFGKEAAIWRELTGGQLTERFFEDYRLEVFPDLDVPVKHQDDCLMLEQALMASLRTVAHVLAQTVALHFYETQVDLMLRKFEDMNLNMERTGSFKRSTAKGELLQLVAKNNLLLSDIMLKLGISERFDAAWKDADCNKVFEELRENLEIEERYENLKTKLNLIQENFRYVLELMQHQKSDLLEWTIIVLISAEIVLSLYELFFH